MTEQRRADPRTRHFLLLDIAMLASLGLAVFLLWAPVIRHYYVSKPSIPNEVIGAARSSPPAELLRELATFRFFKRSSDEPVVAVADKLLRGIVDGPFGQPPTTIGLPFDPADLERAGLDFFLASFRVPKLFLEAYAATEREEFFEAARAFLMAWARYENSAWLPTGLLWNDHAVAERLLVLAEFWSVYRQHPNYRADTGRDIIEMVARHGVLLSSPSHFTVASNHGLMQNLALLHLCLAFPSLPNVEGYKRVALERIGDQIEFYINDEGVILEHSPGYHKIGLELLSHALRYMTLLGINPATTLVGKFNKAKEFYAQVRLPDGRLPLFGDTRSEADSLGPVLASLDAGGRAQRLEYQSAWVPVAAARIYPVAGYAAWWNGLSQWPETRALAQTMISWSYYPGHAHKHADEMSVWVWARGQTWWSNVGYWPYHHNDRSRATSWSASNAPHMVEERGESARQSVLRSSAWSEQLAFIEVERADPAGYTARRQIVWKKPALWVVLDCSTAPRGRTRTVWTSSPDVRMEAGSAAGSFILHGTDDNVFLEAFFFGSADTEITSARGSRAPFAGWGVVGAAVKPAPSVIVEQPAANACAVAAWSLHSVTERARHIGDKPSLLRTGSPQAWKVLLPTRSGNFALERTGDTVVVAQDSGHRKTTDTLLLSAAPDYSQRYDAIRYHHLAAAEKYPKFNDYYRQRVKLTWLLGGAFVIQEGLMWLLKRKDARKYVIARWLTLCLWLVGGTVLTSHLPSFVDLYTRYAHSVLDTRGVDVNVKWSINHNAGSGLHAV
jgi:heparinase II/III-like protein